MAEGSSAIFRCRMSGSGWKADIHLRAGPVSREERPLCATCRAIRHPFGEAGECGTQTGIIGHRTARLAVGGRGRLGLAQPPAGEQVAKALQHPRGQVLAPAGAKDAPARHAEAMSIGTPRQGASPASRRWKRR